MATLKVTIADLPKGTCLTFDRSRCRATLGNHFYAEMWTTEGAHYVATVEAATPPTLHDLIDHAKADTTAWFLRASS